MLQHKLHGKMKKFHNSDDNFRDGSGIFHKKEQKYYIVLFAFRKFFGNFCRKVLRRCTGEYCTSRGD